MLNASRTLSSLNLVLFNLIKTRGIHLMIHIILLEEYYPQIKVYSVGRYYYEKNCNLEGGKAFARLYKKRKAFFERL